MRTLLYAPTGPNSPIKITLHNARVVRDGLMPAAQASIPVATQCCGTTALNGTKRFELLEVKAGSIAVQETIALRA